MIATTLFPMFLGIMHCFEADHVLAVASVSSKKTKPKSLFYQGVTWGIGHSIPILFMGAIYISSKVFLLKNAPFSLEVIVGIMLIVAGFFKLNHKSKTEKLNNHIKAMLLVGLLHGLAGSAGIILAHTATQTSLTTQIVYFLGFALGSMLGMGVINLFIGRIDKHLAHIKKIKWFIPMLSIGYGVFMIHKFI